MSLEISHEYLPGRRAPQTRPSRTGSTSKRLGRHVIGQFHRPSGPMGSVVGWILGRRPSNVARGRHLVELLELEPGHRVMELGPGPGLALSLAAPIVTDGRLVAVDHSELMLQRCADRNGEAIADGRLTLVNADARDLPADLADFDRIWGQNVWHFWPDQETVVAELAARLAPGGRLVIGHQPRRRSTARADAEAARRSLRDQMSAAGLTVEDQVVDFASPGVFVIGQR